MYSASKEFQNKYECHPSMQTSLHSFIQNKKNIERLRKKQ